MLEQQYLVAGRNVYLWTRTRTLLNQVALVDLWTPPMVDLFLQLLAGAALDCLGYQNDFAEATQGSCAVELMPTILQHNLVMVMLRTSYWGAALVTEPKYMMCCACVTPHRVPAAHVANQAHGAQP